MKRLTALWCMLLCVLMLTTVVSCKKEPAASSDGQPKETNSETVEETKNDEVKKDPETANELWKLIDTKMESLNSYEADVTVEMVMYMNGFKFDSITKGYEIKSVSNTDSAYYYSFMSNDMVCDELSYKETIKSIDAYNNGMAFSSNITNGVAQNLCSKMTYEEYNEFSDGSLTDEFDFEDCTKAEFTKNEDGTYKIEFSGYTKKSIGIFLDSVGMEDGIMGADVQDLKITVLANSEYCVQELVLALKFDVDESETAVPVLVETLKYSKYNEAVRKSDDISPEDYTEVDDIRVITKFEDALTEYCNRSEGTFVLDIKQTLSSESQKMEIFEKDTVSFGKMNGGYFYVIDAETTTMKLSIKYRNGIQTLTVNGEAQNVPQTEEDAVAYINGLVDYAKYDSENVTDVKKISDGVYKLVVNASPELLEQMEQGFSITAESSTQEIIVTFSDDKLTKIECNLKIVTQQDLNVECLATISVNELSNAGQNF